MSIIIFIVVIVALIVVHEFGHFVAAKLSGMRVDEFGLGYPPRALTIAKKGGTIYTLNWLPFGGFVKIFGEDPSAEQNVGGTKPDPRAFGARPRLLQAFVLVAGVAMNLVFAYVLITGALIMGTPRALSPDEVPLARDTQLMVTSVLPDSPAAQAGLLSGDTIVSAQGATGQWRAVDPKSFSSFVNASRGDTLTLEITRNSEQKTISASPKEGVATQDPFRYALGVEVTTVGVIPVSFLSAITEGASLTWGAIVLTAGGLWDFFYSIFTFSANLSQVSGPIGIAGVVGTASSQGIGYLLSLMAIISINLALINLIPVPALDGGRLLFVIIESIIRRPINPVIARSVNAVGFVFLIILMVVVSLHDIFNIIG